MLRLMLFLFVVQLAGGDIAMAQSKTPINSQAVLDRVAGIPVEAPIFEGSPAQRVSVSARELARLQSLGLEPARFSLLDTRLLDVGDASLVTGVGIYEEGSGRRIHVLYRIPVTSVPAGTQVETVDAYWTSPLVPELDLVAVDQNGFQPRFADTAETSLALYQAILRNRVDTRRFDPGLHSVLIVLRDSVAADARFEATVRTNLSGDRDLPLQLVRLDATGWPVLRLENLERGTRSVAVYYTPGQDQPADARERRLIAEYDFAPR